MLNVNLVGDTAVIADLRRMPATVLEALTVKITSLSLQLKTMVQRDKLSGQVLNVKTGALRRSIFNKVISTATRVMGFVYSSGDVKYARIHEMGGRTKAHIIRPKKADALSFMLGGRRIFAKYVNHPGSEMPERSYMRSSLREFAPTIVREMKEAVIHGLMAAQRSTA